MFGLFKTKPLESFQYKWSGVEKAYRVAKYTGSADEVVVPTNHDTFPVVGILEEAFKQCNMKSVILQDNIKYLGVRAFCNCPRLSKINIPNGIEELVEGVFMSCTSLYEIILPENITVVCEGAFQFSGLESITISCREGSIEKGAFDFCSSLVNFNLSPNVKSLKIDNEAFTYCDVLSLESRRNIIRFNHKAKFS